MANRPLEYYIDRYTDGTITKEEWQELRTLLDQPEYAHLLDNLIDQQLLKADLDTEAFPAVTGRVVRVVERAMQDGQQDEQPSEIPAIRRVHILRKWWWAAASIILLLGAGAYFWIQSANKGPQGVTLQPGQNDALPGKNGAILTLADGRKVVLDSLGNGTIATQNGSQVNLQNGQVIYDPTGDASETVAYNTMTTPNGRQFQIMLPDGTMAWLNAASSITYPTVFTSKERHVKITGEVYFEVAKDAQKPFTVNINDAATVQVLGTHFNVNGYADETAIKTTLLEGSVNVIKGTAIQTLQPGQQAAINDEIKIINQVNTDLVMAWKNGVFNFNQLSLAELMRQLSRWYDVEVVYTSSIPDVELYGEMGRDLNLSQVLQSLQEMDVKCRLEGRKLIVD